MTENADYILRHPYHFTYPRLLRSAFIHSSQAFMWEHIPNYQRLEFLGDSLLDQAFIMHLVKPGISTSIYARRAKFTVVLQLS
jgi:dsRNA-specific ribonuclease